MITPRFFAILLACLICLFVQTSSLEAVELSRIHGLTQQHDLTLSSPTQKSMIHLLVKPEESLGQKRYILDMRYYGPTVIHEGGILLYTTFAPFIGPPGMYFIVIKNPDARRKARYTCVVQVDDVFQADIDFFYRAFDSLVRRRYILDPSAILLTPFRGDTFPIAVTTQVECLE